MRDKNKQAKDHFSLSQCTFGARGRPNIKLPNCVELNSCHFHINVTNLNKSCTNYIHLTLKNIFDTVFQTWWGTPKVPGLSRLIKRMIIFWVGSVVHSETLFWKNKIRKWIIQRHLTVVFLCSSLDPRSSVCCVPFSAVLHPSSVNLPVLDICINKVIQFVTFI